MPWAEAYSVGVKILDEQHKQLIAIVDRLDQIRKQGAPQDEIRTVVFDVVEYVRTHFTTEEEIMRIYGFPGYEDHKSEHLKFAERFHEYAKDWEKGYSETFVMDTIILFLKGWIEEHLAREDKIVGAFLNAEGLK